MARKRRNKKSKDRQPTIDRSLWDMPLPLDESGTPSDEDITKTLRRASDAQKECLVSSFNDDLQKACQGLDPKFAIGGDIDPKEVGEAQDVKDVVTLLRKTHLQVNEGEGQFGLALELAMVDELESGTIALFMEKLVTQDLLHRIIRRIVSQDIAKYSDNYGSYDSVWSVSDVREIVGSDYFLHRVSDSAGEIPCGRLVGDIILETVTWDGRRFDDVEDAVTYLVCRQWASTNPGWHYLTLISELHPGHTMGVIGWDALEKVAHGVLRELSFYLSEHNVFVLLLGNEMYAAPAMEYLAAE